MSEDTEKANLLAVGILDVLSPAVKEVDTKVNEVRKSQVVLSDQIDRLAAELRGLSDKQRVPVDLDMYIEKLTNSRKRIVVVSDILQNVQDRLEKLHEKVSRETTKQKALLQPGGE
eukprot:Em0016g550a